jgi:hypothetical protein
MTHTKLIGEFDNPLKDDVEREAHELVVGLRVYDRYMDLFGTITSLTHVSAEVKYEYPYDPDVAALLAYMVGGW